MSLSIDASLPRTLPALLRQAAKLHGDRIVADDGNCALSFAELEMFGRRASRAFIAAGVVTGDRVAIWAPNSLEWVFAAVGLQSAGAALVTLNTRFKGAEAGDILRRAGVKILLTTRGFLNIDYLRELRSENLPELERVVFLSGAPEAEERAAWPLSDWDTFLAAGEKVPERLEQERAESLAGGEILDIMFTSGTTGAPKGVLTTHEQNIRVFDQWSRTVGLTDDDVYLIINPFFHSFGYKAGWLSCLIRGCKFVPMPTFDVDAVFDCIEREQISMLPGPPTIFQSLLAHPDWRARNLGSLRLAVTGAASVPIALVERIRDDLGFDSVVTAYGLTETCGVVTICSADDAPATIANTCGRPMVGVEIKCVSADGATQAAGAPGELLVRGYNVMQGYFNDAASTAKVIDADGWLHTGDIAVIDEHGYARITDRIKDMFICGGFNCYPAEIENTLCSLVGIAQAAVIGAPDERMGEVAWAFVVLDGDSQLSAEQIITWCREQMANYKVPRRVLIVDTLPVNAAGKVRKVDLRLKARALA